MGSYVFIHSADIVSPKELTAFRMAPDLMHAMRTIRAKDGIPVAVQIDFAVRAWLKQRGVTVKTERKRASTRKRS